MAAVIPTSFAEVDDEQIAEVLALDRHPGSS